jgi:hypothetical protein
MTPGKGLTGHYDNERVAFSVNIGLLGSVSNMGAARDVALGQEEFVEPGEATMLWSNFGMSPPAPALGWLFSPASGGGLLHDPGRPGPVDLSGAVATIDGSRS